MKKQIITLVIGILIGAIITACIFLIARPNNTRRMPDFSQFDKNGEGFKFNGERPTRNRDSKNEDSSTTEDKKVTEGSVDEKQN